MKRTSVFTLITFAAAATLLAADSSPKEAVTDAAAKLAKQPNYSWKTTSEFGNFNGTYEGKTEKDGLVEFTMTFGDNSTEVFLKNGKGAIKMGDQDWQSLADMAGGGGGGQGRGRFMLRRLQTFKAPAAEATDLVSKTKELKQDGDVYSGDLTEAGAKELLSFGGRRGGNAPEPKNAKGSVKFWVKDGQLSKFELKQSGTMTFNGEDRDIDRTTTVEIKDVGTTKINVPEAAKTKLAAPAPASEAPRS